MAWAIKRSGLFDARYYLAQNPDVAASGMDPALHYIVFGAAEGRDPSAQFDTVYYTSTNPDVAQAGLNPLFHYVRFGAAEGRATGTAEDLKLDDRASAPARARFARYRIDSNGVLNAADDVLIYVAYCADGALTPLQIQAINWYSAGGYKVILVVNSGFYDRLIHPGATAAVIEIVRENVGYDFGAWSHAVRLVGGLDAVHSVTFTNDSVLGPLRDQAYDLRTRVNRLASDAVFMTESTEISPHLQSYFFSIKTSGLRKSALSVLQNVRYYTDKNSVILNEEIPLSSRLYKLGLTADAVFPCADAINARRNPTIHYWKPLVQSGFPFFKISLITEGFLSLDSPELVEVLGVENVALLRSHLSRRKAPKQSATLNVNAPARPALSTNARFGSLKVLQAYNPSWTQTIPVAVPLEGIGEARSATGGRPAILGVIHCYYTDEAERLLRAIAALQIDIRIVLTTDTGKKAAILQGVLDRLGLRGEIAVTPNRGRDVGPFLIEGKRHLHDESIILHLHTKKSPHNSDYAKWGSFIVENLVGTPEIAHSILRLLEEPEIGLVYSEHFSKVRELRNWGYDFGHAKQLMSRLGVSLTADLQLDFPTGMMFWAKTAALRPLFDLGLSYDDFEPEQGQVDGTLAHAIERCVLLAAELKGFRHVNVVAPSQAGSNPAAMLVSFRHVAYMLRRHGPHLLRTAGQQSAFHSAVRETYPVNVARSTVGGRRLNLLIPTLKPGRIYGGIASAIKCSLALIEAMGGACDVRVIVTSENVDSASMQEISRRLGSSFVLAEPNDDVSGPAVIDLHTRRHLPLVLRQGDVFLATAWWTADLAFRLHDRQHEMFGASARILYLMQDYEPGFYSWSNKHALAESTYRRGDDTIALLNTEELANFMVARYRFAHAFCLPYAIDQEIYKNLKPTVKQKKIIAYGRPTVARNLFETIVEGIRLWQGRDPDKNCAYEIVFAGEAIDSSKLRELENAKTLGKASLEQYARLLNESAIGVALMMSPHPSYAPLEMATAGCITITNRFESKDLSLRADNIISLDLATPANLADALERAAARVQLDAVTDLVQIRGIRTEIPTVDYKVIAQLLDERDQGDATRIAS